MEKGKSILTPATYSKFIRDLRNIIEASKASTRKAAQAELIKVYWEVGRRISREKLLENASYGDSVLREAAADLDIHYTVLNRAISFYQAYKKVAPRRNNLTWSHFQELLAVKDEHARLFYETEAEKNSWQRDRLRRAIEEEVFEKQITVKPGTKKGAGKSRQKIVRLKRPKAPTYVYKAKVERVIDGDTLLLRIDLGFQVWKEQRVRLAEIDTAPLARYRPTRRPTAAGPSGAPPIESKDGARAFEFVRDTLAKAETIVIKTHKIDIYGRYVGHVFYSLKDEEFDKVFARGHYLNQELLDLKLAKPT